jgi:hypothetical protein
MTTLHPSILSPSAAQVRSSSVFTIKSRDNPARSCTCTYSRLIKFIPDADRIGGGWFQSPTSAHGSSRFDTQRQNSRICYRNGQNEDAHSVNYSVIERQAYL